MEKAQADLTDYLIGRKAVIEISIAAEKLAGNAIKEQCERTALAEIVGVEIWLAEKGWRPENPPKHGIGVMFQG